jgi:crotonobetainyl-CoA:carnitine CoA-transferase CaiB-like acyl-CoA transferase
MLDAYRVIDLTDERGQLAGMILAALGAEVIAIEPPEGSPARRMGPYAGDVVDPERSLFHWAYNRGKKSVLADLATAEGRRLVADLARGADILLESSAPGELDRIGLGYAELAKDNPGLIYVSITPFGSTGPKAHWAASDITVNAASGQMVLTGDRDRAPLRISMAPQTFFQAAGDAAGAALVALAERNRSGTGQQVDVSAQTSMMASTQEYCVASLIGAPLIERAGGGVRLGDLHVQLVWPCLDGHVSLTLLFGASLGPFARRLFEWMCEEGACTEADRDTDWIQLGNQLWSGEVPASEWERLKGLVDRFLRTKTKAELAEVSLTRKLLFAPLTTPGELAEMDQLRDRDYWDVLEHPEIGSVRYPGRFCLFSATQPPRLGAPPRLGEHTESVLSAPPREPAVVREAAPPGSTDPKRGHLPLAGLKVLDFTWAVATPSFTRSLAEYGATVVKVESQRSVDGARTVGPFRNDVPGYDNTGLFHSMGAGKLGLALDLTNPAARDVVLDLVRWADVVVESFSPKAMRAWDLHYERLKEINPGIVMVSSCLMGQSGPMAYYAGFGTMAAAICGFHHVTGWPDRAPVGAFSAYTDYVAPRFILPAFLAALDHRNRTGEGQYLDFSQLEASLHLLAPALLDYTVNGRVAERAGNDDLRFAPHGVYAGAGDDAWVAVACETDEQWCHLCTLLGRPELAGLDASARLARRRELDRLVSGWTADRSPSEAEKVLQDAGVPAHQMQNSGELAADPQLAHRQAFVEVAHAVHGTTWVENSRFRLSRTPALVDRAGPTFGEDVEYVLGELLGYDIDRIAELAAAEALE